MGLKRHPVPSNWPPPKLGIGVAPLGLFLIILHELTGAFLPEFFQVDRIDIHISDAAAPRFKPRGIITNIYEKVILSRVRPEKLRLREIIVLDVRLILLIIKILMPLHLRVTTLGQVWRQPYKILITLSPLYLLRLPLSFLQGIGHFPLLVKLLTTSQLILRESLWCLGYLLRRFVIRLPSPLRAFLTPRVYWYEWDVFFLI